MLENVALIQAHYPYFWSIIAFIFGSAIGSFLNVVIYRLPVMMMQEWREQSLEIILETTDDNALVEDIRQRLPAQKKTLQPHDASFHLPPLQFRHQTLA